MKRLLAGLLLAPVVLYGQYGKTLPSTQTVNGAIVIPSLMNITIMSVSEQTIRMADFSDIELGKVYRNYLSIKVKSNRPWVVSVMSDSKYFTASTPLGSQNLPVGILSLKRPGHNSYVHLTSTPQQLLHNSNNRIQNDYNIDLKVNPCYNYRGGEYHADIILTISSL